MTEIHPFESFVPDSCEVLVLEVSPGKNQLKLKERTTGFMALTEISSGKLSNWFMM